MLLNIFPFLFIYKKKIYVFERAGEGQRDGGENSKQTLLSRAS